MNTIEVEQEVYGWTNKLYWLDRTYDELFTEALAKRDFCHRVGDRQSLLLSMQECKEALQKLGYGTDGKPLFEVV